MKKSSLLSPSLAATLMAFMPAISCHKPPKVAPAADNFSELSPPPMGATTYNDELKSERAVLDDILEGRVDPKLHTEITNRLMEGDTRLFAKNDRMKALAHMFVVLPELLRPKIQFDAAQKLFLQAKLLFLRRRFPESAMMFTEVLRAQPHHVEARNLRARAVFFLGNPDFALRELEVLSQAADPRVKLDALYLMGAMVFEANDPRPEKIDFGMKAWTTYLALSSEDDSVKKEIRDSMAELRIRREGPKITLNPFEPDARFSSEKNAILAAFKKDELLLALSQVEVFLKKDADRDIMLIKARILIKTGQVEEAERLFQLIVAKHPTYAPARHYQGMAFMLKGDTQSAIDSWQATLKLDPAYAATHTLQKRIDIAQSMLKPSKIASH